MIEKREALAKMFSAKGSKVKTNRGSEYYDSLMKTMTLRLEELEKSPAASKVNIESVLEAEGLDRRDFMK